MFQSEIKKTKKIGVKRQISNKKQRVHQQKSERRKEICRKHQKRKENFSDKGVQLLLFLRQTLEQYFPDFWEEIKKEIQDPRKKKPKYSIESIVAAALFLSLFQEKTRNDFNQLRKEVFFQKNIQKLFGVSSPHMDTVEDVFRKLPPELLEKVKAKLVHHLMRRKVFRPFRVFESFYQVVFDATLVHSHTKEHEGTYKVSNQGFFSITKEVRKALALQGMSHDLLEKMYDFEGQKWKGVEAFYNAISFCFSSEEWEKWKEHLRKYSGNTTWFSYVLEAKLVTSNGFSISLGSEWIQNEEEYDKQDCESKAFVRLSKKVKLEFPKLPIMVVADGLYPNKTVLQQCEKLDWSFILVLKDGNLKSLWKEIEALSKLSPKQSLCIQSKDQIQDYSWTQNLEHEGVTIHFGQCWETILGEDFEPIKKTKFAYISNQSLDKNKIKELITIGRQRQKIENEGFNVQKNHGFALQHKISRNEQAFKNWYQCIQIAHLLYQLMILARHFQQWKGKNTLTYLWKFIVSALARDCLLEEDVESIVNQRIQFRYQ